MSLPSLSPASLAVPSYYAGLKQGDSAYYDLSGSYGFSSSQPVTKMNVLSVFGTNITASFSGFYPDGLASTNQYWEDVSTGQVRNASSNFFFAVTPGLTIYDPIFTSGTNFKVTSVATTQCGGATRQIVSVQFTRAYQSVSVGWDQNTGAVCRLTLTDLNSPRNLSMTMTNTTLWGSGSPDPFASYVIVANVTAALGLPLVALVVFVYFRGSRARKKKRSK